MVNLMSQLKEVVFEEFDGILLKLVMVNWENVLKPTNSVERWWYLLWALAFYSTFLGEDTFHKIHNSIELSWRGIHCEMCDLHVYFMSWTLS